MPYNSRISIVRPTYTINNGGSTYNQIPPGSHTASGLLIASAAFRAGSFLLYGQPLSPTMRTFEGGSGFSITFEGTTTVASGCMFHIFNLSSVNSYPIYGPSATVTISGVSVFYIEEMKALFCTTCMTMGTVALSTSSIFLLNKGNFSGVTGFVFSGSADSSNDWFGIMGNTFDVDTAVNSSFSGNYMSIFGNNYRSVWSQSSSTCFAMCNYVDDIMMAQSPASGCWGSDCTIGTLCAGSSNGKSQCYYPMANLVCNALQPSCACTNAAASTDFCIPFVAPSCGALVVEFLAPGETPAVAAATWCLLAITILSTVKSGLDVVMMAIAMPQRLVKAANVVKAIPPIPPKPTPPPQTMLLEDDVLPSKGTAIVFNDDTDATPSNSEYDLDPEGDFEILKMRAAAAAALQEQNSLDFVDLGRTNLLMIDVPNTPTRVETDDLAHYYNGAGVTHAQVQSQGLLTGVGREEIDWGITLHQSEFAGGDTSPQSLVTDNNISTFSRNDEGSDTTIEKDGAVDDDMKANVSNDATRFHRFGGEHRV